MSDETTQKRKRQPRLNENQRHMIEYLWNVEKMTQADIDRGIEFTSTNFIHSVENTYNKKIYFSDPQAPGQRGTNERLNRELRRIYPVGYNF